jgi:hypothetical protein
MRYLILIIASVLVGYSHSNAKEEKNINKVQTLYTLFITNSGSCWETFNGGITFQKLSIDEARILLDISYNKEPEMSFDVVPCPVDEFAKILIYTNIAGNAELTIIDNQFNIIIQKNIELENGNNEIIIDPINLSKGLNIVNIKFNNKFYKSKLLKQ